MSRTCLKCGRSNTGNANFCISCGTKIEPKDVRKPILITMTSLVSLLLILSILFNYALVPTINEQRMDKISKTNSDKSNSSDDITDESFFESEGMVAEGVLSEDSLRLESEEVTMVISPISVVGEVNGTIERLNVESPYKEFELTAYSFNVDTSEPLEGIIQIEIPYEDSEIAQGYTPEDCLVGLYYNVEIGNWEKTHYNIDTERKLLIISTFHLSDFAKCNNLEPGYIPIDDGTVDLGSRQIFTSNDRWEEEPDYGVFYTNKESRGLPTEFATHYNETLAIEKYGFLNYADILDKMATLGPGEANQIIADAALNFIGKSESYPEHTTTTAMFYGYGVNKFTKLNGVLSHIGGVAAFFQLASDMYYGKAAADTAYSFVKSMVYYRGAAAVDAVFVGMGPYVAVALVGLFVLEFFMGPIDTWNDEQYQNLPEHKKLFDAYKHYYQYSAENGGAKRSQREWYDIVTQLNQKAIETEAPEGLSKDMYFEKLLEEELTSYVELFWKLPVETKAEKVILEPDGFLYGKWGLVHYVGSPSDEEMLVWDYVDKVYNGDVPGFTLSFAQVALIKENTTFNQTIDHASNVSSATKYLEFFDTEGGEYAQVKAEMQKKLRNTIFNDIIMPAIQSRREENYIIYEAEFRKALDTLKMELNNTMTLNFVDQSADDLEIPLYGEHIIVPKSDTIKNGGNLEQWMITLDKDGKGTMSFTTLAHLKAGGFNEVEIYKPEDRGHLDTATPVRTQLFSITDDITEVLIKNDTDYVGTYKGMVAFKDASIAYYDSFNATGSIADTQLTLELDKENKVTVTYSLNGTMSFEMMDIVQASTSVTEVKLEGFLLEDKTISIDGTAISLVVTSMSGANYENGGFTGVETSNSMNIKFRGELVKEDTYYAIKGTIDHVFTYEGVEYTQASTKVDFKILQQISFDN